MTRLALCFLLFVAACESDTSSGGADKDAGKDVAAKPAPDGYEGELPVGDLVVMELGTGTLTAAGGAVDAEFAPVVEGRKVFASCSPDGCTLDLLGRVDAGVAEGSRWEVDLRGEDGAVAAFQKGESRWQTGNDSKDYQVASFYFGSRQEYDDAVGGPGSIELRLARMDEFGAEELIGFVSVQVAFEAVDGQ